MDAGEIERMIEKAVRSALDAADEQNAHVRALVNKHENLLYGNGKEGLTTVVDRLERAVEGVQSVGRRVIETLVVAGVIGLIILVVQSGLLSP